MGLQILEVSLHGQAIGKTCLGDFDSTGEANNGFKIELMHYPG
jgi:hypothetical protein